MGISSRIIAAAFTSLASVLFFNHVHAQESLSVLTIELPGGELRDVIHVRVITSATVGGPIELFLSPPSLLIGSMRENATNPLYWEYEWDTRHFPNGSYELIAKTSSGIQTKRGVTIRNDLPQEPAGSATGLTASEPSPATDTSLPPLSLPPPPPPATLNTVRPISRPVITELSQSGVAQETVEIRLWVSDALDIEVFAGKISDGEGRLLGHARQDTTDPRRWNFRWDTTQHNNGLYGVGAKIKTEDGYFWSKIAEITVLNSSPSDASSAGVVTTPPPLPLLPPPPPPTPTPTRPTPDLPLSQNPTRTEEQPPSPTPITSLEEDAIKRHIREDISSITTTLKAIDERPLELSLLNDSDGDSIPDYDEIHFYQTDPKEKDSDRDGISDKTELLASQDPNNPSSNTISYQNPKEAGTPRPELLTVTDIAIQLVGAQKTHTVVLTGTAPPHSIITLYIFSTPTVVTVETNAEGQWKYTFDQELPDGSHEVYATITNSKGSVLIKSDPVPFIKTAQAITRTLPSSQASTQKPSVFGRHPTSFIIMLVTFTTGIVFISIGFIARRKQITNEVS